METFSIPAELLTDQGTVFVGKLTSQLWVKLGIKHLKTSPYHSQMDGALESWHGTLKSMLRKCADRQWEWDRLLKYLLCAYRSAPHSNTGYSPFEIIYGRSVRGPSEALKDSWDSGDVRNQSMVEWIEKPGEKLKAVRVVISVKEGIAKERMKKYYDKKAVLRNFDEGLLVLLRTLDL